MAKSRVSSKDQLSLLLVVVEMAMPPAVNQAVESSESTQDAPTSQASAASDVEDHGSERDPDRDTNVVRLHGETGNASAPLVPMKTVADVTHVNATGAVPDGVVQDNGPAVAASAVIIAAAATNGRVVAQHTPWIGSEEDFQIQVANDNGEVLGENLEAVKDAESVRERLKTRDGNNGRVAPGAGLGKVLVWSTASARDYQALENNDRLALDDKDVPLARTGHSFNPRVNTLTPNTTPLIGQDCVTNIAPVTNAPSETSGYLCEVGAAEPLPVIGGYRSGRPRAVVSPDRSSRGGGKRPDHSNRGTAQQGAGRKHPPRRAGLEPEHFLPDVNASVASAHATAAGHVFKVMPVAVTGTAEEEGVLPDLERSQAATTVDHHATGATPVPAAGLPILIKQAATGSTSPISPACDGATRPYVPVKKINVQRVNGLSTPPFTGAIGEGRGDIGNTGEADAKPGSVCERSDQGTIEGTIPMDDCETGRCVGGVAPPRVQEEGGGPSGRVENASDATTEPRLVSGRLEGESAGVTVPMNDLEKMKAAKARLPGHARQPMRIVERLLATEGINLAQLAGMTLDELADAVVGAKSRSGAIVKNPRRAARDIHRHLRAVAIRCPEIELPCPPPLPQRASFPPVDEETLPPAFLQEEQDWASRNEKKRGREVTGLTAIKKRTFKRYKVKLRQMFGISRANGYPVLDVKGLLARCVTDTMIVVLDAAVQRGTTASFLAALLRAGRNLYAEDVDVAEDLKHVACEFSDRVPNPELSATELLELDNLAENHLFAATLSNAPEAIVERSRDPGLGPRDRLSRLSAASGVAIKLQFPSLSVSDVACIDFMHHFRLSEGGLELRIEDSKATDGPVWELCCPQVASVVDEWNRFRMTISVKSTFLFVGRSDRDRSGKLHQTAAAVGALIMDELEAVMGLRLGFRKLKQVIVHAAVRAHPKETAAISQAVGLSHTYLEQRWAPVLREEKP